MEYREHFAERCGRLPPDLVSRLGSLTRRPVWVQAVSVGEVMLARTLLGAIGDTPSVISSTTPAGRQTAASISAPGLAGCFHFPIDWPPFVRRTLNLVRPAVFITIETEIWPGLLAECRRRAVPVLMVNGRISERSRRGYRRFSRLLRRPLDAIRLACMQSEEDAARLISIGLPADRVVVTGNMKFDAPEPPADSAQRIAAAFGVTPGGVTPVLVAGSTSPGEEDVVLDALAAPDLEHVALILAPRHKERFSEVAALLESRGVPYVRRSGTHADPQPRVLLLDTLGELSAAYRLATLAFVGGSLVPRGGQNLIEPAGAGVPVLFGPHTQNFAAIADALIACGAGRRVTDGKSLADATRSLLANPQTRLEMGTAGRALVQAHRGATRRTVDQIRPWLA